MRVLIDTNIVLDVVLKRAVWFQESAQVWAHCENKKVEGHLQTSVFSDIFYITRRLTDLPTAFNAIDECLRVFTTLNVDRTILVQARALPGNDFEDNIQIACATSANLDAIVTRDPRDYAASPIPALTPRQLLAQI